MADLRIVDAPVLLQESITDDVKMPTGGLGNYAIRLGDLVWYIVTKEQLASKSYVNTSSQNVQNNLDTHIADKANPHQVTKEQVGLGNVDNTADIDKPVSSAVSSAIITATTDMATKSYVNQKDNLKADKATTLSGYGITDAYTKVETYSRTEIDDVVSLKANTSYVDDKDGDLTTLVTNDKTNLVKAINEVHGSTKGVVGLYDKNITLGVGANGWADTLIAVSENVNQRQVNDGLESISQLANIRNPRNGQRVYVKSYHTGLMKGGGTFVYSSAKSATNDGGIVINGWVRQLDSNEIDPVCFGAKAEFDGTNQATAFDDAPAIQKTVNYLGANSGGIVVFGSGKYWLNSYQYAAGSDGWNIIDMRPNVSFKWIAQSQVVVGNYFDDKGFHIFSGLIAGAPVMSNVHFINPYITSLADQNFMRTQYVRRVAIEFRQCENVSVKDGVIRDIDLSNGVAFGTVNNISQFATVSNMKFIHLVHGTLDSKNIDHTTVYMMAQNSKVTDCDFTIFGDLGWRIACPVELHDSYSEFKNSKVSGYTRGGWFVAERPNVTTRNQRISNITGTVANCGFNVTAYKDTILSNCTADNNVFDCYHPTNTRNDLYYSWQGLFNNSGAESGGLENIAFRNNTINYVNTTTHDFRQAWVLGFNATGFVIEKNTFNGITAGYRGSLVPVPDYKDWRIVGNTFNADLVGIATDAYMDFTTSSSLTNFVFDENTFNFFLDTPKYLVKVNSPNTMEKVRLGKINGVSNIKPKIADYSFSNNFATGSNNYLKGTWYNLTLTIPQLATNEIKNASTNFDASIALPYRSTAKYIAPLGSEVYLIENKRAYQGGVAPAVGNISGVVYNGASLADTAVEVTGLT